MNFPFPQGHDSTENKEHKHDSRAGFLSDQSLLAQHFAKSFTRGLDALTGRDTPAETIDIPPGTLTRTMRGPIRLRTLTTLRWLAVIGQMAAVTSVHFGFGFPLPLGLCLACIAASAWLNLFSALRFSPQHFLNDRETAAFIGFDIVQLCALLALTGGLNNPFAVLLLAPVAIAASILPLRPTVAICIIALLGVTSIGLFHFPLPWGTDELLQLPFVYAFGVWVSLTFSVVFFAGYAHRIAAEAGQMKNALAATQLALAREEQLAAIGGLAAAAAHELGSPLATIQVTAKEMAEDLSDPAGPSDLPSLREDASLLVGQARRCREILGRLSRRDVEGDSILDQISFDLLLNEAAEPFEAQSDGPLISFENGLGDYPAPVIKRLPEILYGVRNVVENAASYARKEVLIVSSWTETTVSVAIIDDGPGFAADILARLGEPYVSARSGSRTEAGRKKGMGLGFFISKTLLERTGALVQFGNRRWTDIAPERADLGSYRDDHETNILLDEDGLAFDQARPINEHFKSNDNHRPVEKLISDGPALKEPPESQGPLSTRASTMPSTRAGKSGAWVSITWPRNLIEAQSSKTSKP
ncbi:MAG: ActS/PrrB/RegB family redox-sensitive histidine kinase [Pseudomonadota bacterium]